MSSTLRELVMTDVAKAEADEAVAHAKEREEVVTLIRFCLGAQVAEWAKPAGAGRVRVEQIEFSRVPERSFYHLYACGKQVGSSNPYDYVADVVRLADLRPFFE